MAGLWRSFRHWRQDGNCNQPHPCLVHVHFAFDAGLADHYLHDPRVLDEYETLYPGQETKSFEIFVREITRSELQAASDFHNS
jgi:hypothetical protein